MHLQQLQIFTLFCLRCDVPADTVEIRNELEICVEKVVSAIEKLLEDEGKQHNKIQSSGD
jgi:hypothetical protein